ncbi:hypothetical protein HAX54_042215 [Datura stramonium]|uniref:Uncharacterized protein n=1 Tax=Datura stramonium TaxID=4076 RepID=A0ABS8SM50_DATST|nr:hypothetical protein [Datura stramonium]
MIQQAIKKAMRPARDKLRGLYATVEVLESDVIALRKDVATLTGPLLASDSNPPEPGAVTSQPEEPKSPPDDWWVGYDSSSKILSDEEIYHSRLSLPPVLTMIEVDPSWKPG